MDWVRYSCRDIPYVNNIAYFRWYREIRLGFSPNHSRARNDVAEVCRCLSTLPAETIDSGKQTAHRLRLTLRCHSLLLRGETGCRPLPACKVRWYRIFLHCRAGVYNHTPETRGVRRARVAEHACWAMIKRTLYSSCRCYFTPRGCCRYTRTR